MAKETKEPNDRREVIAALMMQAIVPVADTSEARNGEDGIKAKAADYASCAVVLADALIAQLDK